MCIRDSPSITLEHQLVDSMAMHLMNIPRNFDVVLTENLFGDILSDEAGVITGSLGMLPSATIGGAVNLYEPVHGSAPDIAGRDLANPTAMLQSAVLMLHHIHEQETAERVQRALEKVYAEGKVLTRDVGGTSGTRAFADAVIAAMETAQTGPKGEETR